MRKNKELVVCSLGLFKNQCTLEVLARIKTCDIVFSDIRGDEILRFLEKISARVKVISGNCKLEKTAQKVVSAFKEFDKICYFTYGNPMFLDATTICLKKEALKAGIKTTVLNAISSFDAIISLLELTEFSDSGIRVVNTISCNKSIVFTPEMDTLFFMIGILNLKGNEKYKKNFIKKLMAVYPKTAEFFIVDVKSVVRDNDTLIKVNVCDLAKSFKLLNERTTLFLPAIGVKNKSER